MYEDELNGKSGDFRNEDTTECVGEGGIDANEGEGSIERFVLMKLDSKILDVEKISFRVMSVRGWGGLRGFVGTFSKVSRLHELSSPG